MATISSWGEAMRKPPSIFTVSLQVGTFIVHARSIQAAILRAQADALDDGAMERALAPLHTKGQAVAVTVAVEPETLAQAKDPQISPARAPMDPSLDGTESPLTGLEVRRRIGSLRGKKELSHGALALAMRNGLPHHPNPMGRGQIFYWSEVQDFLRHPEPQLPTTPSLPGPRFSGGRGPGRPPVYHPPTGKARR
jgi:hypothetical protein